MTGETRSVLLINALHLRRYEIGLDHGMGIVTVRAGDLVAKFLEMVALPAAVIDLLEKGGVAGHAPISAIFSEKVGDLLEAIHILPARVTLPAAHTTMNPLGISLKGDMDREPLAPLGHRLKIGTVVAVQARGVVRHLRPRPANTCGHHRDKKQNRSEPEKFPWGIHLFLILHFKLSNLNRWH